MRKEIDGQLICPSASIPVARPAKPAVYPTHLASLNVDEQLLKVRI